MTDVQRKHIILSLKQLIETHNEEQNSSYEGLYFTCRARYFQLLKEINVIKKYNNQSYFIWFLYSAIYSCNFKKRNFLLIVNEYGFEEIFIPVYKQYEVYENESYPLLKRIKEPLSIDNFKEYYQLAYGNPYKMKTFLIRFKDVFIKKLHQCDNTIDLIEYEVNGTILKGCFERNKRKYYFEVNPYFYNKNEMAILIVNSITGQKNTFHFWEDESYFSFKTID